MLLYAAGFSMLNILKFFSASSGNSHTVPSDKKSQALNWIGPLMYSWFYSLTLSTIEKWKALRYPTYLLRDLWPGCIIEWRKDFESFRI